MTDWLRLSPPGGPRSVEKAREAVRVLVDQAPADREALEAARAELVKAEQRDREQLAKALREQREPISNTEGIVQAREQVAASERRVQARALAIEGAQLELGEAITTCRDEWLRSAQRDLAKSHARAVKAVAALDAALDELGQARAIVWWLESGHGFDRAQPSPSVGLLGDAQSSAFAMANNSPAPRASLMAWIGELVGDSPAQAETQTPAEPAPAATR